MDSPISKQFGPFLPCLLISFITVILMSTCSNGHTKKQETSNPKNYVDLVYPQLDTENSRWFLFTSASRPFGMVNLSPDTQIGGAWGSGYRYKTDTIKGFSHIHGWQISGLSVMPVTISNTNTESIFSDFYSKFSHETEEVSPGYHRVELDRFGITAELSSTTRVGLHKYAFPPDKKPAILFNLNSILGPCENREGTLNKVDDKTLSGELVMAPTHRRPKPFRVFFYIRFDAKIDSIVNDQDTGNYLVFTDELQNNLMMKAGISYTSIDNARKNSTTELSHWDFEKVVKDSRKEWNDLLGRIAIEGGTQKQQRRFYTDLWHALQGRRIISDANGAYPDNTGDGFRIGQLPVTDLGEPKFDHYNSDSFWGAQWTLNTLWGLVYPDITEAFVHSLMQYYKDGGLIPRGPSGGNYTYVMTGSSSTPYIVSAIQKGIINDDLDSIYRALMKNHMPGGIMGKAGYEHNTELGGGLKHYMEKGYVPFPIPEGKFGGHQDGASLTMEYAYQDWTLAQLAKKLGHEEDYNYFMQRSMNYENTFDKSVGWMRPKNIDGKWLPDFDSFVYENGFNEANGAQATWFVPHDLLGLARLMGGKEAAVEKLNVQFEAAEILGFTSGSSHEVERHPEYSRIPINYGNQPSMQTAFVFHKLGRPDLTEFWIKKVVDSVFSDLDPSKGYSGDEDQGLMGSLSVLMKLGLFQMNGGTDAGSEYQLNAPIFDAVTIKLHPGYYPGKQFSIQKRKTEGSNLNTTFFWNDEVLNIPVLRHSQIIEGGVLVIQR